MQKTDILILGQGLAGTLLSYRLQQAGIAHLVIDRGHKQASSNAAAGIVNPVTGRRFVKAWHIDALLEGLSVYNELEALLGVTLLNEITVYRDLSETSALNQWDMRRIDEAYSPYMGKPMRELDLPFNIPSVLGPTLQGAQVNLRELLNAYRTHLIANSQLVEQDLGIDDAIFKAGYWHLVGFAARRIIDCTGAAAISTNTWSQLPWRGTKGEALRFTLERMPRDLAVKVKHFVCPIGDEKEVWLGATNEDHYTDEQASEDGKSRLLAQAMTFGIEVPSSAEQLAAIRPTVRDRRPLVGAHPTKKGLWICNGLGTKGTSIAPYCTAQLVAHLLHETPLDPEIDVANRFAEV